jgi:hypothetical protein
MKTPQFIARQEIGATSFADILTQFLNTRFVMFLDAFAKANGIPREQAFNTAYELLKNAEIPQHDE